jgi:hypothetical protein
MLGVHFKLGNRVLEMRGNKGLVSLFAAAKTKIAIYIRKVNCDFPKRVL